MSELNSMQELVEAQHARRRFLGSALGALGLVAGAKLLVPGMAQAAPAAAAPMTAAEPTPAPTPKMKRADVVPQGDIDILTFALGLERLESAFYAQVLGAHAQKSYLPTRLVELAREISAEEASHAQTIEQTLMALNAPVPAPGAFKFPGNVFISPVAFAWFGYTLEEVGIGAYLGAVAQIQSENVRRAAASIYGSETRHAALLRSNSGFTFAPRYYEAPLTVDQVNAVIAPYLA